LATATSRWVSLLKSPKTTESGLEESPVENVICDAKMPLPSLRNIPILCVPGLATIRPSKVSWFKSPAAIERGFELCGIELLSMSALKLNWYGLPRE
jgi:hypothetical protein